MIPTKTVRPRLHGSNAMKIIADTHTHTIASTHAYATVTEMVAEAARLGLYAIAITDHGPDMPGSPQRWYFNNLRAIPSTFMGVRVLRGVEANITDFDANLDLDDGTLSDLEWVVASIHDVTLDQSKTKVSFDTVSQLYLNAAKNPYIKVIGHCGTPAYKFDYEGVLPVLAQAGKLIEINDSAFKNNKSSVPNCIEIARICKTKGIPIIVNTDAHFTTQLGRFDGSIKMLQEIGFPEELVVNSSVERFRQACAERGVNA